MAHRLTLLNTLPLEKLVTALRRIEFRGLYNGDKERVKPYKKARFSIATVYPPATMTDAPMIETVTGTHPLFTAQPTIYLNQLEIIKTVDAFLEAHDMRVHELQHAVQYDWEGRGEFHMIPPIVERHRYTLRNGYFDLDALRHSFRDFHVKDAQDKLHPLRERYLRDYFIDEVSSVKHMDAFHSNAPLINYGLQYSGVFDFHVVCDGSHRIDHAIEHLRQPIKVILVEPTEERVLVPYYAFPMPFRPTIRLSSKLSEKMYPRLERDKVHLFNDFLKKTLHYDWTGSGLNVSKLRSNE